MSEPAYTLHEPVRKRLPRLATIVAGPERVTSRPHRLSVSGTFQ